MNPRRRRHNRIVRKARRHHLIFACPELDHLLGEVRKLWRTLPNAEKARLKREQAIDFAWGNLACSTNHRVSRDLVEAEYARLHRKAAPC